MSEPEHRTMPTSDSSLWLIIGIVAAATLLGLFILGGFYLAMQGLGTPLTVTDEDRQVLASVDDLPSLPEEFVIRTEAIQESKTRYKDKSIVLVYRYDHPSGDTPLLLHCTVTVKATAEEAQSEYRAQVQQGPETVQEGIVLQELKTLDDWGEQFHYASLTQDQQSLGYFLVSQQGRHVFRLEIVVESLKQETFADLATRCVEQLDSYQP